MFRKVYVTSYNIKKQAGAKRDTNSLDTGAGRDQERELRTAGVNNYTEQ